MNRLLSEGSAPKIKGTEEADVQYGDKERLIKKSRSEILFPSSLEELERIIVNISGKNL